MRVLLFFFLLTVGSVNAQFNDDHMSAFVDVSFSTHLLQYNYYDNLSNPSSGTLSNNNWVYSSTNFQLVSKSAVALGAVVHFGQHIPFKVWRYSSIGMEFKGGLGFRRHIGEVYESEWPDIDARPSIDLRGISLDAPLELYFLRNFGENYAGLSAGYKLYFDYYSFGTPIVGISFQTGKVRGQLWSNLLRVKEYREYSDGTIEQNRAYYIGGIQVSYFFK